MLKGHALAFWKPPQSIVCSRQRVNAHWQRWFQTYRHSDLHLFYFFIIIIRLHFHLGVSFHFFRIAPCFIARSPSRRELQKSKPTAAARARPFFCLSRIVSAWSRDGWTWNANLFYLFISYFFRGLYRWCSREKRNGHNCNRLEKEEQGCDEWKEDNHQTMRHTKVLHFFFFVWERCRFLRPFWKWPDM